MRCSGILVEQSSQMACQAALINLNHSQETGDFNKRDLIPGEVTRGRFLALRTSPLRDPETDGSGGVWRNGPLAAHVFSHFTFIF